MADGLTAIACARCGTPVPEGARFCPACGTPVAGAPREERRVVTVLFGDLSGFVELSEVRDAEEISSVVDRAFARCAQIVEDHGGRVDKIIGDEIMAVFGAPQAHEDDPERAVRTALTIQRALAELSADLERERGIPLRMHIGLNTGEVVAGPVGGSDSYTVLGDAVNTARRIEDVAEAGQILVGEPTYEATRSSIVYRRAGPVSAKGKRLPVSVWEAVAERGLPGARAARAAPLVGRDEEVALLHALAGVVRRDGHPAVVTIVGEAGMGKSRLAAEFSRQVAARGVRAIDGRSLPYGTASPAFAVEEAVRAGLLVDPRADPGDARALVEERLRMLDLANEADRIAALLGLGPAAPPAAAAPGSTTAPSLSTTPLLEAGRTVLERIAVREGLLVASFHELHWADDVVLDFIENLAGGARAPILVVCLTRPELLERRPGWAQGVARATIRLEPLPRERATELLDALAPSLQPGMRESVLDRAGGNPFYLEELARLLLDRGEGEPDGFTVPVSVQALVTARLDALPPDVKRLLQDAAVVGERFWPGALEGLREAKPGELDDAIGSLVDGGFVDVDTTLSRFKQSSYRFRQTIVREVAAGSVPKNLRAEQHFAVGLWLEEAAGAADALRDHYDLIAHHFERAAVLAREIGHAMPEAEAKARTYLERAGDRALGMDVASTAASFFERALGFTDEERDRLSLRLRLADALVGTWRHEAARTHLDQALAEARRLGERAAEAKALRLHADSSRMLGDFAGARTSLEPALALAKEVGDDAEEAASLRSHGLLDLSQGKWSASTLWFRQALARYRALDDRRGEAWSLQNLGWANLLMGRLDDALDSLTEGEAIFTELADQEGAGWCAGMRAWVLLLRGDVMEAGRIAEELERHILVEHPEYAANVGWVLELQRILRSYVEVFRGRLGAAESIARRAVESQVWESAWWAQSLGRYPLFIVALLRRRMRVAETEMRAGRDAAEAYGDPFYVGQFRFGEALLAFESGRIDEAERAVEELLASGETGRIWAGGASVRWLQASILRARGRLEEARALLEERPGRTSIGGISTARAHALLAEIQTELGDVETAMATARAAADEAGDEVLGRCVALRALAGALVEAGDAAGAEEALRDEMALLDETDWEVERVHALALLARVLDALRRHDEAAEAMDAARALIAAMPADTDSAPLQALLLG